MRYTNDNIKEVLQNHGYEDIRTVYGGDFPSQMTSNLSDGLAFLITEVFMASVVIPVRMLEMLITGLCSQLRL